MGGEPEYYTAPFLLNSTSSSESWPSRDARCHVRVARGSDEARGFACARRRGLHRIAERDCRGAAARRRRTVLYGTRLSARAADAAQMKAGSARRAYSARQASASSRATRSRAPVERQRSAAQQHTHDFVFMDGTQKFGLGVLIETRNRPTGRAAGSYTRRDLQHLFLGRHPSLSGGRRSHAVEAVLCATEHPDLR